MSYYYKYKFVSPTPTYAIVKEELKSYFDTGAVDDLMFPTYLNKCLTKLSRATKPIKEIPLYIEDFQARLPDNFHAAREIWMCAEIQTQPYQDSSSFYSQTGTCTVQVSPVIVGGVPCGSNCNDPFCPDCKDVLAIDQAVYKSTNITDRVYRQMYLLKPGNISARNNCSADYYKNWSDYGQSPNSSNIDSFDIRDNKLITNFRNGTVHVIFYANDVDVCGNELMPDNYRIKEYVEAFIKYKVFEVLFNQTNDETFNQIEKKLQMYKQLCDEAYIMADIEVKKETIETKARKIRKDQNRLNKYERMTPNSYFKRNI